ncbi:MAG: UvrD-helicase domain-containing protein [Desulfobulbaceae bacterium]
MRYIADLHVHSPFSRATSKASHLQGLAAWAAVKGIQVVGTGDFTHPGWLRQITENLAPAEPGFFRLKPQCCTVPDNVLPPGLQVDVSTIRFVLSAEISSIYKRGGQVRKVHNILFAPDLASVRRISSVLAGIGNIEADGRPILGLDSRDLLEIVLENAPEGFLVPAHIWTPWFSLFGSKSGFDAIEECFGDLSDQVFALETGLSSDPDMNRLVSALDRFTLISNSDCHSPGKLGREANILTTGFDFPSLREALRQPVSASGEQRFAATIEFYPEEGKYHGDGHRKCGVSMEPAETRKVGGICPECHRPLTVGVLNRVMELADRDAPLYPHAAPRVHSLVPLAELLGDMLDAGPATKGVTAAYVRLIQQYGSELALLLTTAPETIARETSPQLAEAIQRVRSGRVIRTAGYDGEYGVIRVFSEQERRALGGQRHLFGEITVARPTTVRRTRSGPAQAKVKDPAAEAPRELNQEQQAVVASPAHHILVKAGPGTGKTHTLVQRVVRLVREQQAPCTVITFTNRAADELRDRLTAVLGPESAVFVGTLHGYCLHWLRRSVPRLQVAGPDKRGWLLRTLWPEATAEDLAVLDRQIREFLSTMAEQDDLPPPALSRYFARLALEVLVDIDGVVPAALVLLRDGGETAAAMRQGTGHLLVDEFQDLNESQYRLIRTLAATSPVFAIGDPDQAIYGFRGSSPRWFFRFARDLEAEQHVLWRNYRSGAAIVAAAGALIARNSHPEPQVRNEAVAARAGTLHEFCADTPAGEAAFIVRRIEVLIGGSSHREVARLGGRGGTFALGDIAVLYRTGRQAEVLAAALTAHGFPVQVVDVVPFYLSGQSSVLYLWALLAAGQAEDLHLLALLRREQGVGRTSLARVEQMIAAGGGDPWEKLAACREDLPAALRGRLAEMTDLLRKVQGLAAAQGIVPALRLVAERYGVKADDSDIVHLLHMADTFASLHDFASHLQRYRDSVVYDHRADAVTLMTLHAAKGLEFRVVFLVGAEEGLLPFATRRQLAAEEQAEHLEEERRLCYVGMTRAREILYVGHVRMRSVDGRSMARQPSRFIKEIPGEYLTALADPRPGKRRKTAGRQLSLFD